MTRIGACCGASSLLIACQSPDPNDEAMSGSSGVDVAPSEVIDEDEGCRGVRTPIERSSVSPLDMSADDIIAAFSGRYESSLFWTRPSGPVVHDLPEAVGAIDLTVE